MLEQNRNGILKKTYSGRRLTGGSEPMGRGNLVSFLRYLFPVSEC